MTAGATFFSRSYSEARRRFQEAAAQQGLSIAEYVLTRFLDLAD